MAEGAEDERFELDTGPEPGAEDRRPGRDAALAERAAAARARGLQRAPQAEAAARAPPRGASTRSGGIDWAHAESLAWASLLRQGVPIRLTGQDSERGTFSQRHLSLHDSKTGEQCAPIQHLPSATAPFELHNSPLSETACLGFEYGYSVQAPETLVLWEAQFGDFVNGAQVIIDQFIVSALAKWGQTTRLTLLLPHGYEGSGPEHSSGRARALPAARRRGQHPRRQLHDARAVLPPAAPPGADPEAPAARRDDAEEPAAPARRRVARRRARRRRPPGVLDDPDLPGTREDVTRLVLCTGKVYYDIVAHEARAGGAARRGRARRAALPVRRERAARADRELPEPEARRVGPGGAAEHGRARVHAPPPGAGSCRRHRVRRTSGASSGRAPARATPPRTARSSAGSSRSRSTSSAARRSSSPSASRPGARRAPRPACSSARGG